jgi:FkbM family methyltransferase
MNAVDQSYDRGAVNCGRRFGDQCNAAYDLLGLLEPALCVDVGATIGRTALRMLDASPASRVVAYEPFGGNLTYFNDHVAGDARVTLRPVAVADRAGAERFTVPGVVKPGETGWAKSLLGYSSLGHLARGGDTSGELVDVVTLDDEVCEPVRFLKIDVQGGELRVLNGASRLLKEGMVDLIYVEFNGSLEVLRRLRASGYVMFDCAYMAWPTRRNPRNWLRRRADWVLPDWPIVADGVMSMGSRAAHLWPRVPTRAFAPYCAWFFANRLLRCGMQTDLLCVREDFLPTLWRAMAQEQ